MSAAERLTVEEPGESAEKTPERHRLELVPKAVRFASWWSDLRPYLPTPANLAGPLSGVGAGSAALIGRGWAWLWAEGWQDAAMRAGGVVLAGYAGVNTFSMAGPYTGYIVLAAASGWCVAAKLHAPKITKPKQIGKAAPAELAADTEGQGDDEPIEADEVAALIRAVAARQQHQGAHLEDLLTEALFTGWEKAELKAALTDDWALPVESFKLIFATGEGKRQRNREGVRLRHLPPAPARGLSAVPSQPPVEPPVGTLPGEPAEAPVEVAVGPSPTAPTAPSQGAR